MSSYTNLGATGQEYIQEEEYKALFGYPNGKVNLALAAEVPGTSRPFLLQNQMYSQTIPTTAPPVPTTFLTKTIVGNNLNIDVSYNTDPTYPYLTYYNNVQLSNSELTQDITGGGVTWWFLGANSTYAGSQALQVTNNILNQGVPNNLDPAGGYVPVLKIGEEQYVFGNTAYPWTYNVNSGIILFTGSSVFSGSGTPNNNTPATGSTITLSFWRYEGTLGISSSPWTTSGNDIYYTGGNVGIGTSNVSASNVLDISGNVLTNGEINTPYFVSDGGAFSNVIQNANNSAIVSNSPLNATVGFSSNLQNQFALVYTFTAAQNYFGGNINVTTPISLGISGNLFPLVAGDCSCNIINTVSDVSFNIYKNGNPWNTVTATLASGGNTSNVTVNSPGSFVTYNYNCYLGNYYCSFTPDPLDNTATYSVYLILDLSNNATFFSNGTGSLSVSLYLNTTTQTSSSSVTAGGSISGLSNGSNYSAANLYFTYIDPVALSGNTYSNSHITNSLQVLAGGAIINGTGNGGGSVITSFANYSGATRFQFLDEGSPFLGLGSLYFTAGNGGAIGALASNANIVINTYYGVNSGANANGSIYLYTGLNTNNLNGSLNGITIAGNNTGSAIGNVGIGKTNPQYTLDVSGNLNFSGNLTKGGSPISGLTQWSGTDPGPIYYTGGNVGIGTSNPGYTLDVSGNLFAGGNYTSYTNPALKVELSGANLLVYKDTTNNNNYTSLVNTGSSTIQIGSVTPSLTNNLNVTGTVNAVTLNATSDYRIKENISKLDEKYTIDNLNPVKYKNKLTGKEDLGLIAHELQEYYPLLVNGEKDGDDYQSINYIGLIPILINEIKELKNILRKNNLY